jgi:hypothetical protein
MAKRSFQATLHIIPPRTFRVLFRLDLLVGDYGTIVIVTLQE